MNASAFRAFTRGFFSLFPTPNILRMPAVGLDIADRGVRFAEIGRGAHGLELKRHARIDIPQGAVNGGEVSDIEALRTVLTELKETHDLNFIHASIPEEKAYLYKTQVPRVETPEELRNAISFTLEENVPLAPSEAVFDYQLIDVAKHSEDHDHVSVTVLPQSVIHMYLELFHSVGLTPLSFEIEAQSVARSVIQQDSDETIMVVDFGKTRTGISVVRGDVVVFTSTLDLGSDAVLQAIKKYFNVSDEEAEKIKNERGLVKGKNNRELFESIITTISALKDELNKRYIYWNTHTDKSDDVEKSAPITGIIITGRDAALPGLADYLTATMRVPVRVGNVWTNVLSLEKKVPDMPHQESLGYTTAVGLALKDIF